MISNGYVSVKKLTLFGAACAVAACDLGASGDETTRVVADQSIPSFTVNLPPEADDLITDLENPDVQLTEAQVNLLDDAITPIADTLFEDTPITPWENVPTTGTADYIGGIEIVPDSDTSARAFGALTATANFADETITGVGRNFTTTAGQLDGQLTLDAETFPNNDLTETQGIGGRLSGTLTGDSPIAGEIDVPVSADFASDANVIYGGGDGEVGNTDLDVVFVLTTR